MQEIRARQILQSLVQGIDPFSGEELPEGTVLQEAEVMRALLAGVAALFIKPHHNQPLDVVGQAPESEF